MQILVLNSGSTSIKFSFFDAEEGSTPVSVFEGEVSGIGGSEAKFSFRDADGHDLAPPGAKARIGSLEEAVEFVGRAVMGPEVPKIEAIGYRVVHPGARLKGHQRITDEVLKELRAAAEFAPLHDPAVVKLIETMQAKFPAIAHYACFDTVFHETMPAEASTYPLPAEYAGKGVRRYGFHGLSCESIVVQLREAGGDFPKRLVIAHLGGGCSVTAVLEGKSIDTSMGLTPTGGIVMATRPGDLDPGLMMYLLRHHDGDVDAVEKMLNHSSGLAAFTPAGSGDMRALRAAADRGAERAGLAVKVFTRSVTKAIGSYLALMGGLDAVVFAGGIGEHDAASRQEILDGLQTLGIQLDTSRNQEKKSGLRSISAEGSPVAISVVPAEEDRMIATHVAAMSRV
ncbi:acetate/propionate family kinase [Granulicella arctica]|uniref:acetate/propionate family kinase n=1 Tax=Granulicella arctica TaxID=940613 RepID=UPI0021DF5B4F|nr:acetate/propionate family kinase [Granulicella arctica]